MIGTHDHALYMKAQVDNLTGHNEELRKELREVRFEATKARVGEERARSKCSQLEEELHQLREAGAGGFYQTMALPEGMAVASSDVIASLNEQLVQVLQVRARCCKCLLGADVGFMLLGSNSVTR